MGNKEGTGVVGNALMSQALLDEEVRRTGKALFDLDRACRTAIEKGGRIKAIKLLIRGPGAEDCIAIVTADEGGQAVVAFHNDGSVRETLQGLSRRLANGSLKWRKDEYG